MVKEIKYFLVRNEMLAMATILFTGVLIFLCARVSSEEIVTAEFRKTAILICPVSQDIQFTFWTGPGETIYNYPNSTGIIQTVSKASRLEINNTNAGLMIHNVSLEDQGLYKCTAAPIGQAEIRLDVTNVPPALVFVKNVENHGDRKVVRAFEDRLITLICVADGAKPEPNISWSRRDTNDAFNLTLSSHQHENGTSAVFASLTLMASRDTDGAMYVCFVHHPALESPVQKTVELYLYLKPQMEETGYSIISTEGFTTTISCKVFGARPEANISLYLDGEERSGIDKNTVVYNQPSDTYTTAATFDAVMERKYDRKTAACLVDHLALNNTLNKTWSLIVYYPPTATVNGQNVTSLVQNLSIECLANTGNPDSFTFSPWEQRWTAQSNILRELQSTYKGNNKATLNLHNLTYQDSGYYKCFVSNGVDTFNNSDYMAEDEIFLFIKDIPYVVDGHTEYRSSIDAKIEISLDVYSNVEPLHVSIARKTNSTKTTAVWHIKENVRKTVGVSVYNQKILVSGYRVAADFEVQAEENYGDYTVVMRNDIGTMSHYFKVLPMDAVPVPETVTSEKESQTNIAAIVAPTVIIGVVGICVVIAVYLWRRNQNSTITMEREMNVGGNFVRHMLKLPVRGRNQSSGNDMLPWHN